MFVPRPQADGLKGEWPRSHIYQRRGRGHITCHPPPISRSCSPSASVMSTFNMIRGSDIWISTRRWLGNSTM